MSITQKETGGKSLLLKKAKSLTVDVAIGTSDVPTNVKSVAHGLTVGDLFMFNSDLAGTVTEVTAGVPYMVVQTTADAFKISLLPGGSPITFTHAVTAEIGSAYQTIGGLRTSKFSFGSDAVDTTNHGSNEWKEILDDAGIRSLSLSGDGVYSSAANFDQLEEDAMNNALQQLAFADVKQGKVYYGYFKVSKVEGSGSYDGEGTFSISADSHGEIKVKRV